ncbi:MAG: transcriptional repressor [Candidatus Omnitrophica bacterium]|nr:transcriptional repressor [Candidatus Omnitrophota bacterium]
MTKTAEVILFPRHAKNPAQFRTWLASISSTFKKYLEGKGLNLTHQREEVLKCLLSAGNHMSLDDVYAAAKKKDPTIGRATVFRTLKLLEECGLAAEVGSADGRTRFEIKADRPHHDHMICIECGRIAEFESPMMERFQNKAIRQHKFIALWHRHEIFGRCELCAK